MLCTYAWGIAKEIRKYVNKTPPKNSKVPNIRFPFWKKSQTPNSEIISQSCSLQMPAKIAKAKNIDNVFEQKNKMRQEKMWLPALPA